MLLCCTKQFNVTLLPWLPFPSSRFASQFFWLSATVLLIVCSKYFVAVICKCLVRPCGLIAREIDVKILEQFSFGLRMKLLIAGYMSAGTVGCLYKGRCSSKCRAEHRHTVCVLFCDFLLSCRDIWLI